MLSIGAHQVSCPRLRNMKLNQTAPAATPNMRIASTASDDKSIACHGQWKKKLDTAFAAPPTGLCPKTLSWTA